MSYVGSLRDVLSLEGKGPRQRAEREMTRASQAATGSPFSTGEVDAHVDQWSFT